VADGAVLGGLAIFYAINPPHHSGVGYSPTVAGWMLAVSIVGMIGAFMTSYTRARAEALGLDAKVGMLQRPERVVLLSVPQALFGLALNGWVLNTIILVLAVTAWITVVQRVLFVYRQTSLRADSDPIPLPTEHTTWLQRQRVPRAVAKGE
jgi:CDP-diacylglycerol--glycerol-3-phosphate 3-phosphatidyltransferase